MKYNTQRKKLIISEYGRNVQGMIDYALILEDKAERTKIANNIIDIMVLLNPQIREQDNFKHKLWDHLFQMSNFKLDVDSPFPVPDIEVLRTRPKRMKYPTQVIRYRHYGKNIEKMIAQAIEMPKSDSQKVFVESIGNFMKLSYKNWNKSIINDADVFNDLRKLSGGKLEIAEDTVLDAVYQTRENPNRRFQNNRNKNQRTNTNTNPNPNQKRRPR